MRYSIFFLSAVVLIANPRLNDIHAATSKPNIIFILTDDQGWTSSSVQMDPNIPGSKSTYYETPNLQRLANEGMRFSDAYAPAPMCSASRAAIFTGRSPAQVKFTEVINSASPVDSAQYAQFYQNKPLSPPIPLLMLPEFETYAERVKQYAPEYKTALLHKDHVGAHPLRYGFDVYDFHMRGYEPVGGDPKKVFSTANRANEFMEQQVASGTPFVLEVSSSAPHSPYEYLSETFNRFNAKPRSAQHQNAQFAASLYDFDTSLGYILDKVDQLGIADNTYIIFTSDNGGLNGPRNNEPLIGGKGSLWEGGIRVPMIVRGPGVAAGSVSNVPVIGTDIFATVTELAGITAPRDALSESASLIPLLHNGGQLPAGTSLNRAFGPNGELFFHFPHYGLTSPMSAVRDGDYKLVKIYGESGQPDRFALFNLRNSVTESTDFASPLNLASQMPEKTAELKGKLDAWLAGVDASMARRPEDSVEFLWNSSEQGDYPSLWRSTIQVDDLRRESWNVVPNAYTIAEYPVAQVATKKAAKAYQPGLSSESFRFDGNDKMLRPYFQVSDPSRPEVDGKGHSATFEFWVRFDSLNKNQIVFESGNGASGLSLTVGDGNGDGAYNEARFRVLGSNGQSLTATAKIDQYADPTKDFIQLTAVVSDKDDQRYVELYVNGALFAKTQGVQGVAGRLDWDGLDDAGLGGVGGTGLGGAGGTGSQPLSGLMVGEIARMRFTNNAITNATVQANYAQVLDPIGFGIRSVSGHASVPGGRFRTVAAGVAESSLVRVMQERTDVLKAALSIDAAIQGGEQISASSPATPGTLSAGTELVSYLAHFDPVGADGSLQKHAVGSIVFENAILGIMYKDASLALSDSLLGSMGIYGTQAGRGTVFDSGSFLSVSADRRTLSFDLTILGNDIAQLRIVTAAPVGGDFNGDGFVNAADLAIWKEAVGKNSMGDANFDGVTDGSDFLAWQRRLSATPLQTAALSIPEPSSAVLLFAGLSLISLKRRNSRPLAGA